jgi:hypothetical protein
LGHIPIGVILDRVLIYAVNFRPIAHAVAHPPVAIRVINVDAYDSITGIPALRAHMDDGRGARQFNGVGRSRRDGEQPGDCEGFENFHLFIPFSL